MSKSFKENFNNFKSDYYFVVGEYSEKEYDIQYFGHVTKLIDEKFFKIYDIDSLIEYLGNNFRVFVEGKCNDVIRNIDTISVKDSIYEYFDNKPNYSIKGYTELMEAVKYYNETLKKIKEIELNSVPIIKNGKTVYVLEK